MKKISLLIPYFGSLPPMWPFYLESLRRNEFITLHFLTDINIQGNTPDNLKVVKISLHEFFARAESRLNIKIKAQIPYKICELKPLMAFLFPELVKGFKYWAYGDIDLIYGNLPRFLKKGFAEDADVISFREDWLSGAFTVLKNRDDLNQLALQSPDLANILNNPKCQNFDECGRKYGYLRDGYTPEEAFALNISNDILDWSTLVHRMAAEKKIKLFLREYIKESLPWGEIIDYRNGKIIAAEATEYAIYHFVHHKRFKCHVIPQLKQIPDYYYISPTGIYTKSMLKHYHKISRYRKIKGRLQEFFKRLSDSYNYRFKKNNSNTVRL